MIDLFLNFKDENSEDQRVLVDGEKFVIGRHSENDLSIRDSRLSRRHLKIERFADIFVVTDLGSSNGSMLNGEPLEEPQTLSDGDSLELGGVELMVEFEGDKPAPKGASAADREQQDGGAGTDASSSVSVTAPAAQSGSASGGSMFGNFFILAPLMGIGLIIVLGIGLLIYTLAAGGSDESSSARDPYPAYEDDDYLSTPASSPGSDSLSGSPEALPTAGPDVSPSDADIPTPEEAPSGDDKIRSLVISFMRGIAQRDPSPVITSEPLSKISSKIEQYRGSAAVGANIESAMRSRTQIESIARSKNLKPEFVAAAALAKLGNSRGDVVATANGMIDALGGLKIQIGDAFANECVVIIAAYDEGERGQFLQMRDTMTKLATDNPNTSSRKVRTIWFLREQGKLTDGQFELALRFLAIGTIAKDPKSFGIDASPLNLN